MQESAYYREDIEFAAKTHDLDPNLVEAIVRTESAGLAHAYRYEPEFWRRYLADDEFYAEMNPRRAAASYGLMQIMYPTARERGFTMLPEMLFLPGVNLDYGCRHLSYLTKKVGADLAVAAYNGGLGAARLPLRPDISRYVQRVKNFLEAIQKGQ